MKKWPMTLKFSLWHSLENYKVSKYVLINDKMY